MHLAYEDVKLKPQGVLAQYLLSCSFGHELGYDGNKEIKTTSSLEYSVRQSNAMKTELTKQGVAYRDWIPGKENAG